MSNKAKFIIELDYYEDANEIALLIHSKDAYCALHDIQNLLRRRFKDHEETPEIDQFLESIFNLTVEPLNHFY